MLEDAEKLAEETDGLIADFDAMHTIPHNLRVLASRIEPSGGPVTVLSQNYGAMSRQMSDWFGAHVMGEKQQLRQDQILGERQPVCRGHGARSDRMRQPAAAGTPRSG